MGPEWEGNAKVAKGHIEGHIHKEQSSVQFPWPAKIQQAQRLDFHASQDTGPAVSDPAVVIRLQTCLQQRSHLKQNLPNCETLRTAGS